MNQGELFGDDSLSAARTRFFEGIEEPDGTTCLCCGRFGKMYAKKFDSGMARTLAWLYIHSPERQFIHLPTSGVRKILTANNAGKVCKWGLMEAKPNTDDPSKNKAGWYRITLKGQQFIRGERTINSHVITFDDEVEGWRETQMTIADAFGRPFHFTELMEDSPP